MTKMKEFIDAVKWLTYLALCGMVIGFFMVAGQHTAIATMGAVPHEIILTVTK